MCVGMYFWVNQSYTAVGSCTLQAAKAVRFFSFCCCCRTINFLGVFVFYCNSMLRDICVLLPPHSEFHVVQVEFLRLWQVREFLCWFLGSILK